MCIRDRSGHTDVVPVSNGWSTDPFKAEIKNDKLFGRGSCDMKGFIACVLAFAPMFSKSELNKEVLKVANKIASKSNLTITIGKQAFYKQLEMPLSKAYAYTSKMMTLNMMAMDAKEGISAFLEKRKPNWKNK